jgi:hypothetical protein
MLDLEPALGYYPSMVRINFGVAFAALAFVSLAQRITAQEAKPRPSTDPSSLAAILSFEAPPVGAVPSGWVGFPAGTIFADDKFVHGGHWSARTM